MSCQNQSSADHAAGLKEFDPVDSSRKVRLVTLDPGHFHAALVQKSMYADVDSTVHVYAPDGPDLKFHLGRVAAYNSRAQSPTHWNEIVHAGPGFFEKMIADKAGNTVVLSGNNQEKMNYISQSLATGFNVLADKPMVIYPRDFPALENAFSTAAQKKLQLYDIMTERFEITTILQRELSMISPIFGTRQKGSPAAPGVVKSSVHHFYKQVSGNTLTRPPWFFDVAQQGEGMVDVMTHLVDLVQWECFPGQAIDYKKDIQVNSALHWPAMLSLSQFREITKLDTFPAYLPAKKDTLLPVYCNGEIGYRLKGIYVKTTASWTYQDPGTADDTYYSLMRGTKADLVIRQGAEQQFKPTLYIEPAARTATQASDPASAAPSGLRPDSSYEAMLNAEIKKIQAKYPGIELKAAKKGWELIIPEKYKEGHEAHFARVMQNFLAYLKNGNMPAWEVPCMIAKYYTTTKALEMAQHNKKTNP